jgi:hypothetical protein
MSPSSTDDLRDTWASLGIAFHQSTQKKSDPESALISLIQSNEFPDDKKMMGLALLWLTHYSKLVHVERLRTLAKKLSPLELAVLGAIASKCAKNGDHRWKAIVKYSKQLTRGKNFTAGDSENFIKMRGLDPEFAEFGLHIAPIFPDDSKKLLSRREILKRNDWLKYRVLFGTNMRADVASVISLNLADTAYAAAKLLGCSLNTAYRNWNDLEEAGWPIANWKES